MAASASDSQTEDDVATAATDSWEGGAEDDEVAAATDSQVGGSQPMPTKVIARLRSIGVAIALDFRAPWSWFQPIPVRR